MTRECNTCAVKLHGSNRSGMCMKCTKNRKCLDCGKGISTLSSGRCQPCANTILNSSAEHRAAVSAKLTRYFADPQVKAKRCEISRAASALKMQDPAYVEQCRQTGRTVGVKNFELGRTPEAAKRRGPMISASKLAHIHPAYRALYKSIRDKGVMAAEAEQMVRDQQAADIRKAGKVVAANENAMLEKHRREVASRY